jgi:hypothetical protein
VDTPSWDVLISHASEDKDAIARPLADALSEQGISVWFDEMTLRVGDSLRRSIEGGLAKSRFGVAIPHIQLLSLLGQRLGSSLSARSRPRRHALQSIASPPTRPE